MLFSSHQWERHLAAFSSLFLKKSHRWVLLALEQITRNHSHGTFSHLHVFLNDSHLIIDFESVQVGHISNHSCYIGGVRCPSHLSLSLNHIITKKKKSIRIIK